MRTKPAAAGPVLRLIDCEKSRLETVQKKTVGILHALAAMALKGNVSDVLGIYTGSDGEHFVESGRYENSDVAVSAVVRTQLRLAQDQMDGNLV